MDKKEGKQKTQEQKQLLKQKIQRIPLFLWISLIGILTVGITVINEMWSMEQIASIRMNQNFVQQMILNEYNFIFTFYEFTKEVSAHVVQNSTMLQMDFPEESSVFWMHRNYVYHTKGGMECLRGDCTVWAPLYHILWHYQGITEFMEAMALCYEGNCVGIPIDSGIEENVDCLKDQNKTHEVNFPFMDAHCEEGFMMFHEKFDGIMIWMKLSFDVTQHIPQHSESLQYIKVTDDLGCINYTFQVSNPQKQIIQTSSFPVKLHDRTLFTITIEKSYVYSHQLNLYPLLYFISIFIAIWVVYKQNKLLKLWVDSVFNRKHLINQLYKFSLNEVFMGKKPVESLILGKGPMNEFYRVFSELSDKSLVPINSTTEKKLTTEGFKFEKSISKIADSYKQKVAHIMETKNRQILNNRFNLQTFINDMCQTQNKIMKEYFSRMQELGLVEEFFLFMYLAILKTPEKYRQFLEEDSTPIPQKVLDFCVQTNKNVHNPKIILRKIFIDEPEKNTENSKQLQLRVEVILIPKYMAMLKDLDIQNEFARKLNLERQLWCKSEKIQNIRYLLTKHNKNIRTFAK